MNCSGCNKNKWFVKQRSYFSEPLGKNITTMTSYCPKCAKRLKELNNKVNEDYKKSTGSN